MATPQSMTESEGKSRNKEEQITFRFCSECSNMLYPKEDEDAHKLQYTCRTCQYTEDATTSCIFRNVLNTSAGETAGVTQDVGSDPTVNTTSSSIMCCPVICLCCGVEIRCGECGIVSEDLSLVTIRKKKGEKKIDGEEGLSQFMMDWDCDEYDEEMMEDTGESAVTSDSDAISRRSSSDRT